MIEIQSPEQLSTAVLVECAQVEIQQYLRYHPTANACGFELFRRACVLHDDQAWSGLYQLYSNLIGSWILRLVLGIQVSQDDLASLINATFAKFARSISSEKFVGFSSIAPLLAYCKLCTRSVVLDEMRSRQAHQWHEQTIEEMADEPLIDDPADIVAAQLEAGEVWQIVWSEVKNEDEQLVLHHICMLGWPPRELQQCYPEVFASIDDVYRVKRNVKERLRRNRQLLALLSERSLP